MTPRHIKVTVETFAQQVDGSEILEDRSITESWGLPVPQIIEMRKPLIDVAKAWNEGDVE